MKRVVIVGGDISGLASAYRLQQRAPTVEVTVLERNSRPGGTIWTERHDGFQLEVGANGFLDNKPSTLNLCRDLGLGDELLAASDSAGRNRYVFWDGRLQMLPTGVVSFVNSKLLSWRGKLGLAFERFRRSRPEGNDESIAAFARRRAGAEIADILADAIVTGIHAGDPELLSMRATFPRIAELETKYGSVIYGFAASARQRRASGEKVGPTHMWSFRPGLRRLIEQLVTRLVRPPVLGVDVQRVEPLPNGDGWQVHGEGQNAWPADAVVLCCPPYQQATLVNDFDAELAQRLSEIAYSPVVVAGLGYPRAAVPMNIDGFGYIAPQRLRRDVLGVQWCSSIFADRAPPGMVLLRAMSGGWNRPEMVGWDDARLLEAIRHELEVSMGITQAPVFQQIIRWPRAIPQYHLGHGERVAWMEERARRHPGLFLSGNAYHGVAMNDCTEQANVVAGQVQQYLDGGDRPR